jgi:hypothetical protein
MLLNSADGSRFAIGSRANQRVFCALTRLIWRTDRRSDGLLRKKLYCLLLLLDRGVETSTKGL